MAGLAALAKVDPGLPRHAAVSAYLHEKAALAVISEVPRASAQLALPASRIWRVRRATACRSSSRRPANAR